MNAMDSLVHPNIERLRMDITDEASINSAVDDIVTNEGRIDILVNNAGVMCSGRGSPDICKSCSTALTVCCIMGVTQDRSST